MSVSFRPCVLIPTFNNPLTIRQVVEGCRQVLPDVLVVDDGSDQASRVELEALVREGRAAVRHREHNGGKGAAVIDGFRWAAELGFSHAVQVDGDGQHDLADLPRFLDLARAHPDALVLGRPVFDRTAPRSRRWGRLVSRFWVQLETMGSGMVDPLCGFRVYPLAKVLDVRFFARRMGFDPEIVVRLHWAGMPVLHVPTRIRYLSSEQGGISHYRLFWDNLEMCATHTLLCQEALRRAIERWLQREVP